MADTDETRREYAVGYGKPPVATRFRKGESGNPRGKVPGRKNLKTELLEELRGKIPVTENGRRRHLSRQTVLVKRLVADAVKGEPKARDQLLRLIAQAEGATPAAAASDPIGAAKDAEILARFRAQLVDEIRESGI